jgi:hypothetical protein
MAVVLVYTNHVGDDNGCSYVAPGLSNYFSDKTENFPIIMIIFLTQSNRFTYKRL